MPMDACPFQNQLPELLENRLGATEEASVVAHVDGCPSCQVALAQLTADPCVQSYRQQQQKNTEEETTPPDPPAAADAAGRVLRFPEPATERGRLGKLEHYHIQDFLGAGGMGFVYKAWDERLDRVVALKIMKPELAASPDHRARFAREARKAAAIKDEHVVTVHQ